MRHDDAIRSGHEVDRRHWLAGAGGLVAGAAVLGAATPVGATEDDQAHRPDGALSTRNVVEIQQLKVSYAIGTDAITAGDEATGLARYRSVFSPDAVVSAGFDEAAPDFTAVGPEQLAATVATSLAPFRASQHLVGTIDVQPADGPRGRAATVTAYVQATLLAREGMGLTRFLATYHDRAERRGGRWVLTRSFAQYLSVEAAERLQP